MPDRILVIEDDDATRYAYERAFACAGYRTQGYANYFEAAEEIEKGAPAKKCPVCGFTQADFKKTGRLGCSECYVTFAEGLGSLLKAMHKGTEHVGKLPERAQRAVALSQRMRALTENLQKAVEAENYETAASLRDQIRQLESDLSNSP